MFGKEKIKKIIKKAFDSGGSPENLTMAFCVGLFIAFSPFPGGHTVMILLVRWFFGLNLPVLFLAASLNNPWTMIPFYSLDYVFGYWLVHSFLGCSSSWEISLAKVFGSGKICLMSFFVGGNVLGLLAAFVSYPIMKIVFKKMSIRLQKNKINEVSVL